VPHRTGWLPGFDGSYVAPIGQVCHCGRHRGTGGEGNRGTMRAALPRPLVAVDGASQKERRMGKRA
jgi:hypothetical protein